MLTMMELLLAVFVHPLGVAYGAKLCFSTPPCVAEGPHVIMYPQTL